MLSTVLWLHYSKVTHYLMSASISPTACDEQVKINNVVQLKYQHYFMSASISPTACDEQVKINNVV